MSASVAYEPEKSEERASVLVVEDEVLVRLMIAEALRAQGLSVIEASSSSEALSVLRSSVPVHLLLTDIRLPRDMDGLVLARFARARYPDLKLIIASAERLGGSSREIADAFFPKPYDLAAVVRRVKELLTDSRHAAKQ